MLASFCQLHQTPHHSLTCPWCCLGWVQKNLADENLNSNVDLMVAPHEKTGSLQMYYILLIVGVRLMVYLKSQMSASELKLLYMEAFIFYKFSFQSI